MSLSDLAAIGSFISGAAVVVTLILLLLQMRQADKSQRAMIQQTRLSRSSDQLMQLAQPALAHVWSKGRFTDALTPEEFIQFAVINSAMLRTAEDVYFQHDLGFLDAASRDNSLGALRGLLRSRGGRAFWLGARANYDAKFVARIDGLMAEKLEPEDEVLARWKAQWKALGS